MTTGEDAAQDDEPEQGLELARVDAPDHEQGDQARRELAPAHQVEACLVDVGVTPTIDDEFVPCL